MDEETVSHEIDIQEFIKPKCKVKIGDRIYRKMKNMTIPDRMEVIEIKPHESGYFFKVRYMYHGIGQLERMFSDVIFNDESWVIEKKGADF